MQVWIDVLLQAGMPVELCHVHEPGQAPKAKGSRHKTPKKEKAEKRPPASAGRKRKRAAAPESDESEGEGEGEEPDFSQMDRHTEDEEESPTKRPRRMTRPAKAALGTIQESPPAKELRRVGSRLEVVSPSGSQQSPHASPREKVRGNRDEE